MQPVHLFVVLAPQFAHFAGTIVTNQVMHDFRELPDYLIIQAEGLGERLMFGLEPDMDLAQIKDDMMNRQSGCSFIKRPDNGLDDADQKLFIQACAFRPQGLSRHGQWG